MHFRNGVLAGLTCLASERRPAFRVRTPIPVFFQNKQVEAILFLPNHTAGLQAFLAGKPFARQISCMLGADRSPLAALSSSPVSGGFSASERPANILYGLKFKMK